MERFKWYRRRYRYMILNNELREKVNFKLIKTTITFTANETRNTEILLQLIY